jgi:hypothetical protein
LAERKFLYDGWNVVGILDGNNMLLYSLRGAMTPAARGRGRAAWTQIITESIVQEFQAWLISKTNEWSGHTFCAPNSSRGL